eukprot:4711530-Pleurochrysis_carterae.AAC.2
MLFFSLFLEGSSWSVLSTLHFQRMRRSSSMPPPNHQPRRSTPVQCVPQLNRHVQLLSISSLAIYAGQAPAAACKRDH